MRAHHDRLLRIEDGVDALLDLMELALTWAELDYSQSGVIPPAQWSAFVACHDWHDPERAQRIFDLAADVALRGDATALSLAVPGMSIRQIARV